MTIRETLLEKLDIAYHLLLKLRRAGKHNEAQYIAEEVANLHRQLALDEMQKQKEL